MLGLVAVIVLIFSIVAATDNPIKRRYQDLLAGDLELIQRPKFHPSIYFNALQLRLLEFRFAKEIMSEQHSWLLGVTPGDSQDLLDQKYIATGMYIGDPKEGPHRHIRGFIGYNYHNQYLETFVRDGIVGLISLLAIFFLLLSRAVRRHRTRVVYLTLLTIAVFFIPEAPLTMQHGVFLFCFFPLLSFYSRIAPAKKPILS
jgi:O-antigen ligase